MIKTEMASSEELLLKLAEPKSLNCAHYGESMAVHLYLWVVFSSVCPPTPTLEPLESKDTWKEISFIASKSRSTRDLHSAEEVYADRKHFEVPCCACSQGLPGPRGPPGAPGKDGIDGDAGQDGADGRPGVYLPAPSAGTYSCQRVIDL
uniref:Collagen IV NC1 domain-containing protein n=1 Tax=Ascaris lumbricoides TaxID=6252 RepID=A0A0M3I5U5_ASCLU